ncbi:hypothetical protein B0T17DRAFT_504794 [Bombardia bombarda]|uniref:Uncharacterized protein n=1 Tax=Bombardia bombarda TaxID=252184 RepID=A0AA40CHI8_9PEZI|nr:hypothetical protein B0T17DRAFT_504794 [Bombardia bombarda]
MATAIQYLTVHLHLSSPALTTQIIAFFHEYVHDNLLKLHPDVLKDMHAPNWIPIAIRFSTLEANPSSEWGFTRPRPDKRGWWDVTHAARFIHQVREFLSITGAVSLYAEGAPRPLWGIVNATECTDREKLVMEAYLLLSYLQSVFVGSDAWRDSDAKEGGVTAEEALVRGVLLACLAYC